MTIPSGRTDIRARILVASATLFGKHGFHATRTAEIAARARTTERTLFKHFPSKEELYAATLMPALLNAGVAQGLEQTQALFAQTGPSFRAWQDRLLRERLDQWRRVTPQIRMLIVSLLTDERLRAGFERSWRAQVWDRAVAAVADFQRRGLVRRDVTPQGAARMIISVNLGFVLARLVLADRLAWDDEAEIAATGAFVERGLGAKRRARRAKNDAPPRRRRRAKASGGST